MVGVGGKPAVPKGADMPPGSRYPQRMSATLRVPTMTRDQFFDWASSQGERYEFDGFEPVAMTGGNLNHNANAFNLHTALRNRLKNTGCKPLGLDAGVATVGDSVRYPDAVVTCSPTQGTSRLVPEPVIVFEVISSTTGHLDRIVKVREYAAVGSIRRYIVVEGASIGLTIHERDTATQKWTVTTAVEGDRLALPELGIEKSLVRNLRRGGFPIGAAQSTIADVTYGSRRWTRQSPV